MDTLTAVIGIGMQNIPIYNRYVLNVPLTTRSDNHIFMWKIFSRFFANLNGCNFLKVQSILVYNFTNWPCYIKKNWLY